MDPIDEADCKRVVFEFASAMNEWEIRAYISGRLEKGQDVAPARQSTWERTLEHSVPLSGM